MIINKKKVDEILKPLNDEIKADGFLELKFEYTEEAKRRLGFKDQTYIVKAEE